MVESAVWLVAKELIGIDITLANVREMSVYCRRRDLLCVANKGLKLHIMKTSASIYLGSEYEAPTTQPRKYG